MFCYETEDRLTYKIIEFVTNIKSEKVSILVKILSHAEDAVPTITT